MAVSKKIEGFISQASWIRRMFEDGIRLKQEYGAENVFDFTLGNPDVEPPPRFKEILREIAADPSPGKHVYMPNAGYPRTRRAVAEYLSRVQQVPLAEANIVMTSGAGGALNVILKTLLDPGDEVVIPTPFFVEYRFYVDNHGGTARLVPTRDDFSLDLKGMEEAVTEKTKAVLINSPNNPTGKVYGETEIRALAGIIARKGREFGRDIYLISDEPYRDIVYDGAVVPSIMAACPNSVIATSYSKNLSIPGERIGYIAAHPGMSGFGKIMEGFILCNRILGFVNAPAIMQRAVALMQGETVDPSLYRTRRDLLCDGLSEAGYRFEKPKGAFYLFPRTPIEDDVKFVKALQEKKILTVPGSGFGGPGHFRIAYCVEEKTITGAMKGFREVMEGFK
ncbi:MAG: pyridoxal phosphate-dependent aminotransferase [Syntrophales bacterium]|nr:pyridoxal phosphate-dependent aminotransferase [Syntrophales bacterium]MDD5232482.1 pyridoxal phosphate-dependent aminotransferase [Syntrophales bacterium]MDD5531601.1 pyridoxal phosphate-dependent aminotransferase [Syntrophales bacterium]